METCIYKGLITHRRFKPKRHFFSYKTFSILFDLDELIEITHRISVIFEGKLSESLNTKEVDISKLGLLMGGKNE